MPVTGPGVILCDVTYVPGCRKRYFLVTWLLVQLTYNGGDAMGYSHVGCYPLTIQPTTSQAQGAVTVQWCLDICENRPGSYPFIGLRRNGRTAAMATCYCVASLPATNNSCPWTCGSGSRLACGGWIRGQSVSIYTDNDECLTNNGGCNQTCNNSPGSFSCSCLDGYSQTGASCVDIDECDTNNGGCAEHCTNTQGSYSCGCDDGYLFNGMECNDIDECSIYNGGCEHHCNNTMGSFHCTCSPGYQRIGTKCTDIDECARDNGGCDKECHNTAGSHLCRCRDGYQQKAGVCTDIDECRDSPCEQSCHNVDGGFHCYCEPGWAIMEDNVTCAESQKCDSRYSNTTPIWVYIVIGLLGAVVIAMAVVIVMLWRRLRGTGNTNSASTLSRPMDPRPGSERDIHASSTAGSREDRPTDPEDSAAPTDSQYEQIKLYTNSEAAQGVYEKVA